MKEKNWIRVKEILQEVLEIEPSKRLDFLEKAGITVETRAEVESLMAFEEESEDFMSLGISDFSKDFAANEESEILLAGQKIGVYEIVRELGQGGMGAVYLATRADGKFSQRVALKLLKREMNTSALRRRFQQEQEILASLEHSNIARLLDAGTTNDKIPFLAMEYVEGLPIDKFCHIHQLDLNQRLDLFRQICSAVSFAHRNLIVHRDLKPSNILVNDDGVPKLLDFGISKILSSEFEPAGSATVTRLGAMTPGYASPEQLQSKSVTTATDIYSLGIILYELLSGHRPFETKESDLKEIYKAVLESEPPPPSAMVNTFAKNYQERTEPEIEEFSAELFVAETKEDGETEFNKTCRTIPDNVNLNSSNLRGDLDNIVLKALRKEPERRYLSAENLAEDIHRHQRGLPVTARPNTLSYRAEKFFKRNRASVFAGILIILAVISGVVATLWQARVAAAERDRAQIEAAKANKINEYMQNVLNFSNPGALSSNPKRNREATVAEAMDEALKNIDTNLGDEPEIQAELLVTIGSTYHSQGQYDKAIALFRQAVEKFDGVFGADNLKSMQTYQVLASSLALGGKNDEAEQIFLKVISYFRLKVVEDKIQTRRLVLSLNDLANIYNYNSNYPEAEKLYRESIENFENLNGRKERLVIPGILSNLAWLLHSRGDFEQALKYYNQAQAAQLAGDKEGLEAGTLNNKIGVAYTEMGDYAQAEIYYRKAYDILMKAVGEENFYTVSVMYRTAYNDYRQGRYAEALTLVNKSLGIQRKVFPNGHNVTAFSERLAGEIATKTGDPVKGEEFLRKALDYLLKKTKEPNRDISRAKLSLSENLIVQKRFTEAEELADAALDGSIRNVGENHPFTKECRAVLSRIPK